MIPGLVNTGGVRPPDLDNGRAGADKDVQDALAHGRDGLESPAVGADEQWEDGRGLDIEEHDPDAPHTDGRRVMAGDGRPHHLLCMPHVINHADMTYGEDRAVLVKDRAAEHHHICIIT